MLRTLLLVLLALAPLLVFHGVYLRPSRPAVRRLRVPLLVGDRGAAGDDDDDDSGDGDGNADGDGDGGSRDGDDDEDDGDDPDGADKLGDAGKKALDTMKGKWRSERDKRKELQAEIDRLKAGKGKSGKPAKGGDGDGDGGDQPDADQIRADAAREAQDKANLRIVRSEVKALAASKFADPADAVALLLANDQLSKFDVDDDGNVDEDEINEALDELLEKKPHLAATAKGAKKFTGGADKGARGDGKKRATTMHDAVSAALSKPKK